MAGLGAVGSRVGLSRLTYAKGKDRKEIKKLSVSRELLYNGAEVSSVEVLRNLCERVAVPYCQHKII